MRQIEIIEVPYHLGLENVGVGQGPGRLLRAAADRALHAVEVTHIRKLEPRSENLDGVVDVNRQLGYAVRSARSKSLAPLVLAGNCNSCLGTIAGLEGEKVGIVWFDAHGDFNTPETSISGLLEGMALAAAVGDCHDELRERIGLATPVADENVVLLGARDLDPGESVRLKASRIALRPAGSFTDVPELLAQLAERVSAVYVHIDVDFLDPRESPGTNFRGPGGLSVEEGRRLLGEAIAALPIAAVALTNYNPDLDQGALTERAALRLLDTLL
jgi:arginase